MNEELGLEEEKEPVDTLLEKNRANQKRQFDRGRKEAPERKDGELVVIRSEAPATGRSRKLEPKYRGPYEIAKTLEKDRYVVRDIEGEQQSARKYEEIAAVDRVKGSLM